MIIDLDRFVGAERPYWNELESLLARMENEPDLRLDVQTATRFHYLYQRTSSDLSKLSTFAANSEMQKYLEQLVARAYSEIHETGRSSHRFQPLKWFFELFPQTFRKHIRAFQFSLLLMLVGAGFGGFALALDADAKRVLVPFGHLQSSPSERVAAEESQKVDHMKGVKTTFSTYLMTHNIKVSIFTLALGATYGIGTIILLFYNGVILGAVAFDYMLDGQTRFLFGWLLPHGAIEIPAILVAGQAGLVLASALIGWGSRVSLRSRLREITPDLVILVFGIAIFLVWAGMVEAFMSQYHEPVLPYSVKITFGVIELILLVFFLWKSGAHRGDRNVA